MQATYNILIPMRRGGLLLMVILLLSTVVASAQFSMSKVKPSSLDTKMKDSIKQSSITNEFFSKARWDAERRAIRKQRNMVEFNSTLQVSQSQFENWAAGGDNTFSGRSTIFFRHVYNREKLTVDYGLEARYGINVIDDKPFKNEDEFKLNFQTSWKIRNSWSYAGTLKLRSQFSNGFKSRADKTIMSSFMAPGFLDVSFGFNYRHRDNSPFSLTLSPVTGSLVVVLNEELSEKGINGVEKGRKSKGQVGPSLQANFDKTFGKNIFRYRSMLYSFTNIKTTPTARWENTFEIRATKFITTTLYALAYYDKYANTPKPQKLQLNYAFTIGLAYRFKNK